MLAGVFLAVREYVRVGAVRFRGAALVSVASSCVAVLSAVPPAAGSEIRYGVSTAAAVTVSSAKRMENAHVRVLRVPISFDDVHGKGGRLRWSRTDRTVRNASEEGIRLLPYLTGMPRWASRCTREHDCAHITKRPPLTKDPIWDRFVSGAVDRYGTNGTLWSEGDAPGQIECWQVWDTANRRGQGHSRVSPVVYSRVLQSTYASIKVADPTACVLTGSAMFGRKGGRSVPLAHLRAVLASDAKYSFTAVSVSPRAKRRSTLLRQVRRVREVVAASGRSDAGTWVSPIGWASDHSSSPARSVGLSEQRRRLLESFAALTEHRRELALEGVVWSAWSDGDDLAGCRWCRHSGLVRSNGRSKPARRAFSRFVGRSNPVVADRPVAAGQPVEPAPTTGLAPSAAYLGVAPSEATTDRDLSMMASAGVGTARVVIFWPAVQPTGSGPYDWSEIDAEIRNLARHGIGVVPELLGDPTTVEGLISNRLAAWKSFVQAAVMRYSPGGELWRRLAREEPDAAQVPPEVWEVWNEQNARPFWPPGPSPDRYAELLLASADAIRSIDPDAKVMVGGMYGYPRNSISMRSLDFLADLYRIDGVKEAVDIVGLHPYSLDTEGVQRQFQETLAVMDAAGDRDATTWVTEIGWSSDPSAGGTQGRTREGQAQTLSAAYELMLRNRKTWRLQGVIWFTWRDPGPWISTCSWCKAAGLVTHDLTPKPAFYAFSDVASTWSAALDG